MNEQWQSYWAERFARHGYLPADTIRQEFWDDLKAGIYYPQNGLIYASEEARAQMPKLREAVEATNRRTLDVVHPHVFMNYDSLTNGDRVAFGRYVRAAPFVVRRSLARWVYRQRTK